MKTLTIFCSLICACSLSQCALAHDIWVETNVGLIRVGDSVAVDLKLGNHGNHHRDFKLAGKVSTEGSKLEIIAPGGGWYDLKDRLADCGYMSKEGYWSANFTTAEPGVHCAVATSDRVVKHAKMVRSIQSSKTYFLATQSLDKPTAKPAYAAKPLGLPMELVLESDPVLECGPDKPIRVRLLLDGKPAADKVVSFIPRGANLKDGFDKDFESRTDAEGRARFVPKEGNLYLIVAHHDAADRKSDAYESTHYSATLTIRIPQLCPCCGN